MGLWAIDASLQSLRPQISLLSAGRLLGVHQHLMSMDIFSSAEWRPSRACIAALIGGGNNVQPASSWTFAAANPWGVDHWRRRKAAFKDWTKAAVAVRALQGNAVVAVCPQSYTTQKCMHLPGLGGTFDIGENFDVGELRGRMREAAVSFGWNVLLLGALICAFLLRCKDWHA